MCKLPYILSRAVERKTTRQTNVLKVKHKIVSPCSASPAHPFWVGLLPHFQHIKFTVYSFCGIHRERGGGGRGLSHTGTNSNTKLNIIHSTCTIQRKLHLTFCAYIQSASVSSVFCVKRHWQYMSMYTSCTCRHALLSALRRERQERCIIDFYTMPSPFYTPPSNDLCLAHFPAHCLFCMSCSVCSEHQCVVMTSVE